VAGRSAGHLRNLAQPVELWAIVLGEHDATTYTDPACRMRIAQDRVVAQIRHEGTELRFCSLACVTAFVAAPERYTPASSADRGATTGPRATVTSSGHDR
jgi:YHS domain-containing protein